MKTELLKQKKGMTLVEIVIALAIFGIMMVTIFPAILVLNLSNRVSSQNVVATYDAQSVMEELYQDSKSMTKADAFTALKSRYIDIVESGTNELKVFDINDGDYHIKITFNSTVYADPFSQVLIEISSDRFREGYRSQVENILEFRP